MAEFQSSPPSTDLSPQVRRWAVECHLAGIVWVFSYVLAGGLAVFGTSVLGGWLSSLGGSGVASLLSAILQLLLAILSLISLPLLSSVWWSWLVWRAYRDRHPFVDRSGRLALNFQISAALYTVVGAVLWLFLVLVSCGAVFTGNPLLNNLFLGALILGNFAALFWMIFQVIVAIVGAVKAWRGQLYKYPFARDFIGGEPND